jgi:ZIP family zinc transporter
MPLWLQAGAWGSLAGSALLLGAAAACFFKIPTRLIAAIMAFGSGVLISALAFELMDEAVQRGGFPWTAAGFLGGAVLFTVVNVFLNSRGARHRKRSGKQQVSEAEQAGSGLAIAAGALLDGIPESIVIGVGLLKGEGVGLVTVVAIFLSNLPEGISSAAGMKRSGRSLRYIFGVWGGIAVVSGIAAMLGCAAFHGAPPELIAATMAVAAGAILAMLSDTMIPEAFEEAHAFSGLITAAGFLVSFALSKIIS